jgi:hypothetical protein
MALAANPEPVSAAASNNRQWFEQKKDVAHSLTV